MRVTAAGTPPQVLEDRASANAETNALTVENVGAGEAFVAWRTRELPPA